MFDTPGRMQVAGDNIAELAAALSKPIQVLYENVSQQLCFRLPACISPKATLIEMVAAVVDKKAHRLWVCDEANRPIGVVSLTDMIQCIMRSEK
jgi:CBS-domain-containing membrane protein